MTGKKPEIEVLGTYPSALGTLDLDALQIHHNTLDMQCFVAGALSSQHLIVLPNTHPP